MPEHIADRRAIASIWKTLASSRALKRDFPAETTVIYRLLLPPDKRITLEAPGALQKPRRFDRDKVRIYWVDSDPWALYGKPAAYFVFSGGRVLEWKRMDTPIVVSGRRVSSIKHDPFFEIPVANTENYYRRLAADRPWILADTSVGPPEPLPPPPVPLGPLTYPLPPSDLPGGGTAVGEPGTTPGSGPPSATASGPCTPLYLALGLLFQGEPDGPPDDPDNLGREIREIVRNLGFRGYGNPNLPPMVVRASSTLSTLAAMIGALMRQVPAQFCTCPPDQLVIAIAGHGYGPGLGGNPNSVPAIHLVPHGGGTASWVTHAQLAQALGAALAARGLNPSKVILIIYSCRSGDGFNPGRYGQFMKGSLIITATPDGNTLSHVNKFSVGLIQCLRDSRVKTWADLVRCIKTSVPLTGGTNKPAAGRPPN